VIVYGSRTAPSTITTYYACLRPVGKALYIGVDELGSVYGSDATTGGFRAAGTYAAAQSSTGEASLAVCARYSDTRRCTPAQHWITVVDTQDHRQARIPIYASFPVPALVPFPVTLALSPKGAVAWLENSTTGAQVTSRLQLWATLLAPHRHSGFATAPVMIDAGSIDPFSVRFDRRTLYWIRGRGQHRQALH
jgi:hypothetical protein